MKSAGKNPVGALVFFVFAVVIGIGLAQMVLDFIAANILIVISGLVVAVLIFALPKIIAAIGESRKL